MKGMYRLADLCSLLQCLKNPILPTLYMRGSASFFGILVFIRTTKYTGGMQYYKILSLCICVACSTSHNCL